MNTHIKNRNSPNPMITNPIAQSLQHDDIKTDIVMMREKLQEILYSIDSIGNQSIYTIIDEIKQEIQQLISGVSNNKLTNFRYLHFKNIGYKVNRGKVKDCNLYDQNSHNIY
jgi:hypothetical protein